jgi:hypothetical protein
VDKSRLAFCGTEDCHDFAVCGIQGANIGEYVGVSRVGSRGSKSDLDSKREEASFVGSCGLGRDAETATGVAGCFLCGSGVYWDLVK